MWIWTPNGSLAQEVIHRKSWQQLFLFAAVIPGVDPSCQDFADAVQGIRTKSPEAIRHEKLLRHRGNHSPSNLGVNDSVTDVRLTLPPRSSSIYCLPPAYVH